MTNYEESIDLKELFKYVINYKKIIIISTIIFFVLGSFISLRIPDTYKASALISTVKENSSEETNFGFSGLGGFGSFLGSNASDRTLEGIEILRSYKFFKNFSQKHNVTVPLFASKRWDKENRELKIDNKLYDVEKSEWVVYDNISSEPSSLQAFEMFRNVFTVSLNDDTGYITISVEHISPDIAKYWVDNIILEVNNIVKNEDLNQAQRSIELFNEQLTTVQLAELRSRLLDLMKGQIEIVNVANTRPEYLFKTIDPAYSPEIKHSPNRILIILITTIFGFLSSIMFFIFRFIFN